MDPYKMINRIWEGGDRYMWKNYLKFLFILLCIIVTDSVQAKAYTIKMQQDNIYSEVIPESFTKNAPAIFRKNVKTAMKYYNKYKDADAVTYMNKIPDKYRDFIEIARKIHDSDEIVLRDPFYIYDVGTSDEDDDIYYFFDVEKNGKKLCKFSLNVDRKSKKLLFGYSKMNRYFQNDSKTMKDALFYRCGRKGYAETPDKTICVEDGEMSGQLKMQTEGIDWEAVLKKSYKKFQKKTYEEKKDEIFSYLEKMQKNKVIKKAEKNMKLELKDDYVETAGEERESNSEKIPYVIIGIVFVVAAAAGIFLVRKQKRQ